ncbi:MAG: hypothetical protein RMK00_03740 [Bacteroidota bacterium]|nr:hypothetical protein [Candidatus Kapabacteria bacterium]MDW8074869.1 hypothetical protein [Bacteroidota bacterium]
MTQRRGIEIYFVLYLAALMLLVSDSPRRETDIASTALRNLLRSTFSLLSEKQTLLCRVHFIDDSFRIVLFDSVNTIIPTGLIDSLRYSLVAEDQSNGNTFPLPIDGSTRIGAFEFTTETVQQALRIRWQMRATELQPRLFRVRVQATAVPRLPPALEGEQRRQLESLLATQEPILESETTFLVGYLPEFVPPPLGSPSTIDTTLERRLRTLLTQRQEAVKAPDAFTLVPEYTTVYTIPYLQWENRIMIYGASLEQDLQRPPQVIGIPSPQVIIERNTLIIRSTSTQASSANVRVLLTRRDGFEATATFVVITQALEMPNVPAMMHPGVVYHFVPNLPVVSGTSTRAVLRDGDVVRTVSNGEPFTFVPTLSDTGHTFYFERFVGTDRIGQTIPIPCAMFPPPEILSIRRESERTYIVQCRGYGLRSDPRARLRLELEPPATGKVQELYGDTSYDDDIHARLQQFRVTLSSSVSPVIRAVNGYQQRSAARELSSR